MGDKILSLRIQKDILRALSVFHPKAMTAKQYLSCFGDIDGLVMMMNVNELIRRGLVHQEAIRYCEEEPFLCLGKLKLLPEGYGMATCANSDDIIKYSLQD